MPQKYKLDRQWSVKGSLTWKISDSHLSLKYLKCANLSKGSVQIKQNKMDE